MGEDIGAMGWGLRLLLARRYYRAYSSLVLSASLTDPDTSLLYHLRECIRATVSLIVDHTNVSKS